MALAFLLVGGAFLLLSATVRVGFGRPQVDDPPRGTIVMVPWDRGGARMELEATEAGPFPVRWNPAADLNYSSLRNRALRKAADVEVPYAPQLANLESRQSRGLVPGLDFQISLPPLPERELAVGDQAEAREVGYGLRVLQGRDGVSLLHAALFLPAGESAGVEGIRYLLEYDRDGRVLEVTRLDSGDPLASVVAWVGRARVEGHRGEPGWLVVESVIGS